MKWIDASDNELRATAYQVADSKAISEGAVEKDWWITAILKTLFSLSPSPYMYFKGGTSLSKGWNIIDRFSEDIDIALFRDFYIDVMGKECAKAATNNQIKNLRIANRDYILGDFVEELKTKLIEDGNEEKIENEIKTLIKQCDKDSDAILLGCTHYALYKNVFMKKCCSKLFIEGSKELIYDLPLDKFNNKKDINIILTKDDDDYLLKINKFINSKYNIHKIKL